MRKDGGRLVAAGAAAAALCALSVCLGCVQKPPLKRYGIVGGAVTLEPELNAGTNLSDITWKKGENIVAEWDQDLWYAPRFQGKAELDSATGSLTLVNLQPDDSGEYRAEVQVGGEIQCTLFSLHFLEPPKPPQLNCTAVDDHIQVHCEPDDRYAAEGINLTYQWKYQKSNKEIPGDKSEIWVEKDVDHSENITCFIHVLDANASQSIRLKDCIPTGAALQERDRAWLVAPFVILLTAGLTCYFWKRGCFSFERKGKFNLNWKGKSQECEDGTDATEVPPEAEYLHEECPGNSEENSNKGPSDPGT